MKSPQGQGRIADLTLVNCIPRRQILDMAVEAGALILTSGRGAAAAQSQAAPKIELYAAELEAILSLSQPIQQLVSGPGGAGSPFGEGPVWVTEGRYLLFNNLEALKRLKYSPGDGVT